MSDKTGEDVRKIARIVFQSGQILGMSMAIIGAGMEWGVWASVCVGGLVIWLPGVLFDLESNK